MTVSVDEDRLGAKTSESRLFQLRCSKDTEVASVQFQRCARSRITPSGAVGLPGSVASAVCAGPRARGAGAAPVSALWRRAGIVHTVRVPSHEHAQQQGNPGGSLGRTVWVPSSGS